MIFNQINNSKKLHLNLLLFTVAITTIFDLLSTLWLVKLFGNWAEWNPIMYRLFCISPKAVVVVKLILLVLFIMIIPIGAKKNYALAYRGTQIVVLVMIIITLMHIRNFVVLL